MIFPRLLRALPAVVLVATLLVAVGGRAQVPTADPDHLHEQLDEARADVDRIQEQADSVAEQIDSLDAQVAAVSRALDASRSLVSRTQAEISGLRARIRTKQQRYDRVQERSMDIAVSLYKAGSIGQLEPLLSAKTLDDISSALEYSSAVSQDNLEVMVTTKRLEVELAAETAELDAQLDDYIAVRDEQEAQAQHLSELREAQELELADLTDRVEQAQREASAIAAESARVTAALAEAAAPAAAPVAAPGSVGASGFAWPIGGSITSGYGPRWGRMHTGIDIDCVTGAPIRASKAGRIVSATYDGSGYGYYTVIDHGGGFATLYAHMSEQYVSGGSVAQGETIGACGSTGASTGDHLHFEVRVNGSPQDPLAYLP